MGGDALPDSGRAQFVEGKAAAGQESPEGMGQEIASHRRFLSPGVPLRLTPVQRPNRASYPQIFPVLIAPHAVFTGAVEGLPIQ